MQRVIRDAEGLKQENFTLKGLIDQLRADNTALNGAQSELDRLRAGQSTADKELLARTQEIRSKDLQVSYLTQEVDKLKNLQSALENDIKGRDRKVQELINNLEGLSQEARTLKQSETEVIVLKEEGSRR